MLALALLLQTAAASPLAVRPDTARPHHHALSYDVTLVLGDSGHHVLGEVQTRWRLDSEQPVELQLDSTMRVIRVLVNGQSGRVLGKAPLSWIKITLTVLAILGVVAAAVLVVSWLSEAQEPPRRGAPPPPKARGR